MTQNYGASYNTTFYENDEGFQCLCGRKEHFRRRPNNMTYDEKLKIISEFCSNKFDSVFYGKEIKVTTIGYDDNGSCRYVETCGWRQAYEIIKQENKLLQKKILLMSLLKNENTYLTAIPKDILNIILQYL